MTAPTAEMVTLSIKAPELAKGTKGSKRTVVTNSFKVALKPNTPFFLHDFRVNAVFLNPKGEEKLKEVTKQTRQDYVEQDRKRAALLACLAMKKSGVLKGEYIYDRAALLIGLQEIAQCKGGEFVHVLTPASAPALFALDSIKEAKEVRVTIKKAAESYQVTTNDITSKDPAVEKAILSVINLATSQTIFEQYDDFVVYGNGNCYLMDPSAHGFAQFDIGSRDKYGGVGMNKGARVISGATGRSAAVTIDTKKTAFHVDFQKISEKMQDMGCAQSPMDATAKLAGLQCTIFYSGIPAKEQKARRITIGSVSNRRVKDIVFTDDKTGKKKTLAEYLLAKYKTRIVDQNAHVIVDKYEGNFYAPECLLVCPNQRMKKENACPSVIEKLIKESATLPQRRLAETKTLANCLQLGAANSAQAKRGMTVNTGEPIQVEGRGLGPVMLGTGAAPISAAGPWVQGKYAQNPSDNFKKWTCLHIKSSDREGDLTTVVVDAVHKATKIGGFPMEQKMSVKKMCVPMERDEEAQLTRIFQAEKAAGTQFIMIMSSLFVKNHGLIKFLEMKHMMVTQQITTKTAEKMGHQSNTASNIAIKVIEKLGGQNHFISRATIDLPAWMTAKGTMICAIQMEMPQSMTGKEKEGDALPTRPVMIGWSSDSVRGAKERGAADAQQEKEATHFASSWTYSLPKDYQGGTAFTASYKEVVLSILRAYKKYRDTVPSRIILIRGGLASGDYDKIRSEEVPIWQEAFKSLNAAYNPTFVIIAANDSHVDRFYNAVITGVKAPQQNLPSGTVIDSVVTNPAKSQAYIQAHVPLQGTAKVPLYSVEHAFLSPAQKMTMNMDDVIRIIHALCFAHGVCNTPTAVPTPLYVARESMKRAAEQFAYWHKKNGGGSWSIDTLIDQLTIKAESDIYGIRVNA